MGDHDNQDDLAAAMALMQQQMLQMQQTMQARNKPFRKQPNTPHNSNNSKVFW